MISQLNAIQTINDQDLFNATGGGFGLTAAWVAGNIVTVQFPSLLMFSSTTAESPALFKTIDSYTQHQYPTPSQTKSPANQRGFFFLPGPVIKKILILLDPAALFWFLLI